MEGIDADDQLRIDDPRGGPDALGPTGEPGAFDLESENHYVLSRYVVPLSGVKDCPGRLGRRVKINFLTPA
jgi:hypothetical protein